MKGVQSAFVITLHHSIYRVAFDGVFFGDYRSESNALESIAEAQHNLAAPARVFRTNVHHPSRIV